jgi:hypothetical protein
MRLLGGIAQILRDRLLHKHHIHVGNAKEMSFKKLIVPALELSRLFNLFDFESDIV